MPDRRHTGVIQGSGEEHCAPVDRGFAEHLGRVLNALYDPAVLRASPLVEVFDLRARRDPISELQRLLIGGIDDLRPAQGAPRDTRAWRIHQILRRRYVEQLTQRQVAADLGLSRRQLQREERSAREALAAHLWARYALGEKADRLVELRPGTGRATSEQVRADELARLGASDQAQATDVGALVGDVLATVRPLLEAARVSAAAMIEPELPRLMVRASVLRQALLNVTTALVHCAPGGEIAVAAGSDRDGLCISVRARAAAGASPSRDRRFSECVEIAQALVRLLTGSIEVTPPMAEGGDVEVRLRLPQNEPLTVLVIDDNEDALRLVRRYLHGSRYHFVGTSDPQEGLHLAQQVTPRVVVLDVMMPDYDGWMLLGQLREHPATRGTPVIVCTILAQEELALALGAAEYLRKPVTRAAFLAALDRQVASPAQGRG
jgi:CheY-like chemotaxis protein/transcriptional regulator with XRE-family HTH domain